MNWLLDTGPVSNWAMMLVAAFNLTLGVMPEYCAEAWGYVHTLGFFECWMGGELPWRG